MRRRLLALMVLCTFPVAAQTRAPQHHRKDHLKFVLILSRHGVRPPLTPAGTLNERSSDPWPAWEVPLGHLTPHGAEALTQLGLYHRADLDAAGLFTAGACPLAAEVFLYSDTDERNISSTRATFAAFNGPACPALPVYIWKAPAAPTSVTRDPNFLSIAGHSFAPPAADAALAAVRAVVSDPGKALGLPAHPELQRLASILSPGESAHPADRPILDEPIALAAGTTGDPILSARGPAPIGGALVGNIALEYLNAKPLSDVAWGRLGANEAEAEATLRRLLPLEAAMFNLAHRTPLLARAESSNLLAHILDTLQQAAVRQDLVPLNPAVLSAQSTQANPPRPARIDGAFGPATARLVYISAHDTNLAGVAALLGLHWTSDGVSDDIPPDSEIVFELWQKHHNDNLDWPFTLRIRYRAQTLSQLRHASPLNAQNPPVEQDLKPIGCHSAHGCTFGEFLHAARAVVDPAYTQLDNPPMQPAP